LVRRLKLEAGNEVELVPAPSANQQITLALQAKRSRQEIVNDLRAFAGRLPEHFVFDRDEAYRPSRRG
jgi:hypothetical protein